MAGTPAGSPVHAWQCDRDGPDGTRTGPARAGPGPSTAFSGGLGRQSPDACRASEPATHEIAQVEPGGAASQPGMVLGSATVTEFDPAAAGAGDLGDDPFHVGPILTVLLPQSGLGDPVAAGLAQQVISLVQNDFTACLGRGAPRTQRAVTAQRTETRHPGPADGSGVAGRATHRARFLVNGEVID